jgi:DNA repair protein RadC
MARRISASSGLIAPHQSDQPVDRKSRLCDTDSGTLLFADSGVRHRHLFAAETRLESQAVSVMARLLAPFAGQRADRTARRLLDTFGSLDRTLSASDTQIVAACGGDSDIGLMIAAARELIETALHEAAFRSEVNPNDPALHKYLVMKFRCRPVEELHAIFIDSSFGYISGELVAIGDSSRVESRIRPILQRAMELQAHGFLLVHNHPSGEINPSIEDINATKHIALIAKAIDLKVVDHFIIAGNSVVSMRQLGLL